VTLSFQLETSKLCWIKISTLFLYGNLSDLKNNDSDKRYAAKHAKAPLAQYAFERREPRDYDSVLDIQNRGILDTDLHQAQNECRASPFPGSRT